MTASDLRRVARRYLVDTARTVLRVAPEAPAVASRARRDRPRPPHPRRRLAARERRAARDMTTASTRRAHAGTGPTRFDLDGGTLAILESSHDVPLVSLVVALRCGSAVDPPGKSGLARIADANAAPRLRGRSPPSRSTFASTRSAPRWPSTRRTRTSPSTRRSSPGTSTRSSSCSRGSSARPRSRRSELARLKRESVAEIIEARDNDRVVAQKAMQRTLFEGHPYGQSSGGTTQSRAGHHARRRPALLSPATWSARTSSSASPAT